MKLLPIPNEIFIYVISKVTDAMDAKRLWCVQFRAGKKSQNQFYHELSVMAKKKPTVNGDILSLMTIKKYSIEFIDFFEHHAYSSLQDELINMHTLLHMIWENVTNFLLHITVIGNEELKETALLDQLVLRGNIIDYSENLYRITVVRDLLSDLLKLVKGRRPTIHCWLEEKPDFQKMTTLENIEFLKAHLLNVESFLKCSKQMIRKCQVNQSTIAMKINILSESDLKRSFTLLGSAINSFMNNTLLFDYEYDDILFNNRVLAAY